MMTFLCGLFIGLALGFLLQDSQRRIAIASRELSRAALAEATDQLRLEREAFRDERRELLNRAQARDFSTWAQMESMTNVDEIAEAERVRPANRVRRISTGSEI